jgi:hypothetical protein
MIYIALVLITSQTLIHKLRNIMNTRIEDRIRKIENKINILADQLNFAMDYMRNDPASSLTKSRIILEKIIIKIYITEMGSEPKKNEIGYILNDNQFTKKIERRIISRMNSVRDMANLGPHGEDVIYEDAARVLNDLCDILDWYFERYLKDKIKYDLLNENDEENILVHSNSNESLKNMNTSIIDSFSTIIDNPSALYGKTIGKYNIKEHIGDGGSGIVFRANRIDLNIPSVLKILFPVKYNNDHDKKLLFSIIEAVQRGIRGISSINHQNIIRIFDFDEIQFGYDKTYYIGMEYIRGKTLDEWSRQLDKDNSMKMRFIVCLKILKGLHEAHNASYIDFAGFEQKGIVHGDLKPTNIIVRDNDEPVIIDFMMDNIQRLQDPLWINNHHTKTPYTAAFGTIGFMPPEQENDGIVTQKTDIYSLGITFLHIFNDNLYIDNLPPPMIPIVEKMISRNSDERQNNISEIIEQFITISHFFNVSDEIHESFKINSNKNIKNINFWQRIKSVFIKHR